MGNLRDSFANLYRKSDQSAEGMSSEFPEDFRFNPSRRSTADAGAIQTAEEIIAQQDKAEMDDAMQQQLRESAITSRRYHPGYSAPLHK